MASRSDGKLALVTGASSGIGLELAHQFIDNGFDVIIVAEDDKIEKAASELKAFGGTVTPVRANLATFAGVEQVYEAVKMAGRPLAAAALNAGVGVSGDFARETKLEDELNLIAVNVASTVHLAKRLLADMVARNEGRLLFTASIAALSPGPYMATYNASKAFILSLSNALRNELKDTQVTVTALMPGATETDFFDRAHMQDTELGQAEKDDPADVAKDGFEAMMAGKSHVIAHSMKSKMDAAMEKILPTAIAAELEGRAAKPGSAEK